MANYGISLDGSLASIGSIGTFCVNGLFLIFTFFVLTGDVVSEGTCLPVILRLYACMTLLDSLNLCFCVFVSLC